MTLRVVTWLLFLLFCTVAFAEGIFENIEATFGNEELLYSTLILPVVQFLKDHTFLQVIKVKYGKWGVIGMSLVVGILLTAFGKLVGIADLEQLTWLSTVTFGVVAGATGSGLKDFLKSILGGKGAPPTDNNTSRAAMDRARSGLR